MEEEGEGRGTKTQTESEEEAGRMMEEVGWMDGSDGLVREESQL